MADFIANELGSPDYVLSLLESDLGKNLIVDLENQQALSISITEFLHQYLGEYFKDIKALKDFWLESAGKNF